MEAKKNIQSLDFESFLDVFAASQSIKIDKLQPDVKIVSDLGVVGDDFYKLIEDISKVYNVDFSVLPLEGISGKEAGFNPFAYFWYKLSGKKRVVHDISVFELFELTKKAQK